MERESYSVESIIKAMSELEDDIRQTNSKVEDIKKRIVNRSHQEIEKLKQQIISTAEDESEQVISRAKGEAEAESVAIVKESEENLKRIQKNIDSFSDEIVDNIVKMIIRGSVSPISGGEQISKGTSDASE